MKRTLITLELFFLTFYVLRSVSGILDNTALYLLSIRISLSVALGILMVGTSVTYLLLLLIKRDLVISKIGWIFLGWIMFLSPWVILSVYNFGTPGLRGPREWIRLLALFLFFLTLLQIARKRGFERVINATLLALPVPLGVTYYQLLFKLRGANATIDRTAGTMAHPNILAFFMVIMISLTVWKFLVSKTKIRYLWALILLIEIPALITPSTMNGWIMIAIVLVMLLLFSDVKKIRLGIASLAIILIAMIVVGFIISPQIRLQFRELWKIEGSPKSRLQIWTSYLSQWTEKPIFGYGLNTANFVFPIKTKILAAKGTFDPHNDYIRYLVEGGIFGVVGFLLFQFGVGWILVKKWISNNTNYLFIITISLYLGWLLISLTDNAISITAFQIYFWGVTASALATIEKIGERF